MTSSSNAYAVEQAEQIAARLTQGQRHIVSNPVNGVISGLFCVSDTPSPIDELHGLGICSPRFEPTDFATRGYRHAGKITALGRSVRLALRTGGVDNG